MVVVAVMAAAEEDRLLFPHLLFQTERSTLDLDLVLGQRTTVVVKVLGLVHLEERIKGTRMGKAPQVPVASCNVANRKAHC